MFTRVQRLTALVTIAAFTQSACYNTHFITKTELEKLESSVEPKEFVEVYGDCPTMASLLTLQTGAYAQLEDDAAATDSPGIPAEAASETVATEVAETQTASDATVETPTSYDGCTKVSVSAGNALFVKTTSGDMKRVTPFNFIMSQGQIVSPEYDLLERLDNVEGAEVDQFSTWKTVGTIVGVSAIAIGTFVGISLLAPDSGGFNR